MKELPQPERPAGQTLETNTSILPLPLSEAVEIPVFALQPEQPVAVSEIPQLMSQAEQPTKQTPEADVPYRRRSIVEIWSKGIKEDINEITKPFGLLSFKDQLYSMKEAWSWLSEKVQSTEIGFNKKGPDNMTLSEYYSQKRSEARQNRIQHSSPPVRLISPTEVVTMVGKGVQEIWENGILGKDPVSKMTRFEKIAAERRAKKRKNADGLQIHLIGRAHTQTHGDLLEIWEKYSHLLSPINLLASFKNARSLF